jgi:hypothetical protein
VEELAFCAESLARFGHGDGWRCMWFASSA